MKTVKIVSVVAITTALWSGAAFAGNYMGQGQGQGQGQAQGQMQGQAQGQAQGQGQNQSQSANSNSNAAAAAAASASSHSNSHSNSKSNSNSNQKQSANNANSISIEGDNYEVAVSSAYAPGLTAGVNPCALSYSGGVSAMDFGFAIGGVVNSEGCEDRANIATLVGLGERQAAVAYACMSNPAMAKALGDRCPAPAAAPAAASAPAAFNANIEEADLGYTPPRLGGGKLRNRK